jgi:hypothetical protein
MSLEAIHAIAKSCGIAKAKAARKQEDNQNPARAKQEPFEARLSKIDQSKLHAKNIAQTWRTSCNSCDISYSSSITFHSQKSKSHKINF